MDSINNNLLLLTDSYKVSHHLQYPKGMTFLKSYFESRGGKYPEVVFFGLQRTLKKYLTQKVTTKMIDEAEQALNAHYGRNDVFNREGWTYIVKEHKGKIPIRIRAVPEGSLVPVRNVLFTVESTDPKVPWVVNYFESLLVQSWYPMTCCTGSFMQKRVIKQAMEKTADTLDTLDFKLYDFGVRGCTSMEQAGIGGAAHLVNFKGTDNLVGMMVAQEYYGTKDDAAGYSIPATEHSTMTVWGRNGELSAVRHMLETFPTGGLSIVSDSYDLWNFLDQVVGQELRDTIEGRSDGTVVIRPDSGDPTTVVIQVLEKLEESFGSIENKRGFKMLPDYLRIIQGDGICYETICGILDALIENGWSAENITFGSGGALLQRMDRDTQKCAYKCCLAEIDGKRVEVFKDPVTDPGKTSKKGDLTLVRKDGQFFSKVKEDIQPDEIEALVTVFENGELIHEYTLDDIRRRAMLAL